LWLLVVLQPVPDHFLIHINGKECIIHKGLLYTRVSYTRVITVQSSFDTTISSVTLQNILKSKNIAISKNFI